jgi:hypothetical protein
MDLVWLVILVAVIVAVTLLTRPFRHGSTAFFWPWYDNGRGDRAQEAYIAEEEMRRSTSTEPRDPDLAP